MSKFCIIIPTTDSPVELASITQESADINSVLCLKNSFQALPVSAAYDAFIRRPTGIIQKLFGDKSYRTDLSAPITQGQSWQLGITIGHLAYHHDSLTALQTADPKKDMLIFSTGCVLPNLDIAPVDHIQKKTQLSEDLLIEYQQRGGKITIFMHPDNLADIAFDKFVADDVIACRHLSEVSTFLGLELNEPQISEQEIEPSKGQSRLWSSVFAVGLTLLSLIVMISLFIPYSDWKNWRLLEEDGQHIALSRSIKKIRRDGNWIQANTAIFFEQFMIRKSDQLVDQLGLFILQNDCATEMAVKINSDFLPTNLDSSCPVKLQIVNNGTTKINLWLRKISDDGSKATQPHGTILGPGQTFVSPSLFLSSKQDLIALFATDRPSKVAQQWLVNLNADPRVYAQATSRFALAGIGLKVMSFTPSLD